MCFRERGTERYMWSWCCVKLVFILFYFWECSRQVNHLLFNSKNLMNMEFKCVMLCTIKMPRYREILWVCCNYMLIWIWIAEPVGYGVSLFVFSHYFKGEKREEKKYVFLVLMVWLYKRCFWFIKVFIMIFQKKIKKIKKVFIMSFCYVLEGMLRFAICLF